jgi:Rad3-related DNA helicase
MKEDYSSELKQLVGEDVSEDFIVKASALFEAAVALKVDEIEQNYAATLDEEVEAIRAELTEQVDQYLSFTAQEWLKENEVAIETSLKNELTEEFIEGMKALFAEHYMEIPSDKVDLKFDKNFSGSNIQSILRSENEIHQVLPYYKYRQAQESLALRVGQAFKNKIHALIQAPTGTGKTMGYLLPSMLFSMSEKETCLVATGTKTGRAV